MAENSAHIVSNLILASQFVFFMNLDAVGRNNFVFMQKRKQGLNDIWVYTASDLHYKSLSMSLDRVWTHGHPNARQTENHDQTKYLGIKRTWPLTSPSECCSKGPT